MNSKDNRRVRMTKRLMKEALLELLEQHELSRITVTAICETADVHRSTFYNYYHEPADLLREIEQDFLDHIPLPPTAFDPLSQKRFLFTNKGFFDYVKKNVKALRILLNKTENNGFASRFVDLLCDQYLVGIEDKDELNSRFKRLYIANGTVGMLREWIEQDFPMSSENFADLIFHYSRKTGV